MRVRKVLTLEQINSKFDKIMAEIHDRLGLVQEKTRHLEETIRNRKVLFGHVPSEVSDDLVKSYEEIADTVNKLSRKLLDVNTFDVNNNCREDCRDVVNLAYGEQSKLENAHKNFYDILKANREILFPSVQNGFVVEMRKSQNKDFRDLNFILNGDLELARLAQEMNIAFEEPECHEIPKSDDFEDFGEFAKALKEIIAKNRDLKHKAMEKYINLIRRGLTRIAPRTTRDFYIYEWRLEGKVIQYLVSRKKKVKNNLRLKGNAKADSLLGRMFFMEGVMFAWIRNKQGKVVPNLIPGGTPNWPMCMVDLLTNETLNAP